MIIFKDFSWQTRSDKPNKDWTNSAKYIIDDNSELAQKVMTCKHGFTPIEDENGNLIDVTPNEAPTPVPTAEDQAEALKTAQLKALEDRQEFIEDCMADMAMTIYA